MKSSSLKRMICSACWLLATGGVAIFTGCGRGNGGSHPSGRTPTILDDRNDVLDATAFGVASKSEVDAVIVNSVLLADLTAGRLFDFDDSAHTIANDSGNANLDKPVFCVGEVASVDEARVENKRLFLRYEADVTACANSETGDTLLASDDMKVDKQVAAFAMNFACSARDLSELALTTSARAIMAAPAAFACTAAGNNASTARAYQFASRTEGRVQGPRAEVPVAQRFWRGYDSGSNGGLCTINKTGAQTAHGACRVYERSEAVNLVDNSRRGRLLVASTTPRQKAPTLFSDGSLNVALNGWSGNAAFSSQVNEIKVDLTRPGGECAGFVLRPLMAGFQTRPCQ